MACVGLTMDENGSLCVVGNGRAEVSWYQRGESQGAVVAGGNGSGCRLDQLSDSQQVFVDRDHSVAKQDIVVAGGQGQGTSLTQLSYPRGVVVDQLGTVSVTDLGNVRIIHWPKGATQGSVIVDGNGERGQSNQFKDPIGLSFDRHGNLYVVDGRNTHVQKFNIDLNI
ncbi:unnamed protein product [Rotaria socialis]|uniref:NHL repeat-containing protein n=1 Tax=Rotaria socialis TaxID=392032 RepID=A0A817LVG9_9BILA|nr:unnamed protein product [Rotaria socialis]CAF3363470.1 unnamed protein product [Rotaria socialis]CAF3405505.1 unnamed protein product [Rotaria socialis]CAF3789992.1 unnamed protein product [Rotaria socialis]